MANVSNDSALIQELFNVSAINPQQTYQYQFRDTFYALVPPKFKPYYYQVIRRCLNWYSGYVPEVHRIHTGMFSTAIGNMVVKEVTKLIMGGKLFAQNAGYEQEEDLDKPNDTLLEFNKWSKYFNWQNTVSKFVEFTAAGGTGALKSNITSKGELKVSALRIDQFFFQSDYSGNCIDFVGFLKSYSAKVSRGSDRNAFDENFYVVEHRFYDENGNPKVEINAKRDFGQVTTGQTFDLSTAVQVKWEQLPKNIQKMIKDEFGKDIILDKEEDLPFDDIGIDLVHFTNANRTPEISMGEPVLLNVLSYLFEWDYAFTSMMTDQYIGRGKVLVPMTISNPNEKAGTFYEGFDRSVFTKIPNVKPENQKPISVQFDLRMKEHTMTRNLLAENIATQVGISGSDMFPFLRDATGSKTATQIASESQKTISYIEEKRNVFTPAIDNFIKRWRKYYDMQDDFIIRFSSQNMVNKLVTVDEVRAMKEIGMSMFDTFQKMFPAIDEAQIWQMVNRSKREKEEILRMQTSVQAEANLTAFEQRIKNINNQPEGQGINEKEERPIREELDEIPEEGKKQSTFGIFRRKKN
jgi:hypothetical protein